VNSTQNVFLQLAENMIVNGVTTALNDTKGEAFYMKCRAGARILSDGLSESKSICADFLTSVVDKGMKVIGPTSNDPIFWRSWDTCVVSLDTSRLSDQGDNNSFRDLIVTGSESCLRNLVPDAAFIVLALLLLALLIYLLIREIFSRSREAEPLLAVVPPNYGAVHAYNAALFREDANAAAVPVRDLERGQPFVGAGRKLSEL